MKEVKAIGRSSKSAAIYFLPAFMIALILHIAPLLIFFPYREPPKKTDHNLRFTVMVSDPEMFELNYWLENAHPEIFTKPDMLNGYTSYERKKADPFLELPEPLPIHYAAKKKTSDLIIPPRPPEKLLPQEVILKKNTEPGSDKAESIPFTVFTDGRLIRLKAPGTPRPNEEPVNAVYIRVRKPAAPDFPPQLSLEKSCGVQRLDKLAYRAAMELALRFSSEDFERIRFISIDWLPASKEGKK